MNTCCNGVITWLHSRSLKSVNTAYSIKPPQSFLIVQIPAMQTAASTREHLGSDPLLRTTREERYFYKKDWRQPERQRQYWRADQDRATLPNYQVHAGEKAWWRHAREGFPSNSPRVRPVDKRRSQRESVESKSTTNTQHRQRAGRDESTLGE